ncbi:glycosyltransferase [Ramlibacter sp. PS3R-8]|uniref:glycosyltransferase family 4 protein n=1 Tax=Ramlibacter sp. PS3R-8 TaxID=3133437 RepID=UPI003098F1EC
MSFVKIAYLVSQYPAPSHTFVRREIAALRKRGMQIDVFSVRPPRPEEVMSDVDRADCAETTYLLPAGAFTVLGNNLRMFLRAPLAYSAALTFSLRHRNRGVRALLYALFYFLEGMLLAEHLHRRGVGHLHNHFANAAAHAALVATRYLGIRLSLTLHGLCDFEFPAGPLLGDKIRESTFVACATQYGVAQAMRLSHPAQWNKLLVVRCGVELDKLPPRQPRDASGGGPIRIICVGRLAPEKGQLGLIDAFAMARSRGLDAELVLLGDGPDRAAVMARVVAVGMGPHVKLLGRQPEGRALEEIGRSDVLVLASFMEGLPVVLMEAMALGVPVVAPDVAGIPELVRPGESGLLFTAGDWAQLAERMCALGNDPALRAQLAAAARHRIEEEFDMADAVLPLFQRLAGPPPAAAPPRRAHATRPGARARPAAR